MTLSSAYLGIDVGSTTVKLVVMHSHTRDILWKKYQRHETRQAECLQALLQEVIDQFPDIPFENYQLFITGSGAGPLAPHINASFVQEVNAVTLAVEALHPDVSSVIELGGQDAKIIVFKTLPHSRQPWTWV